ncbi:HEAT repeat domain-containing protein [Vulcanococcus sp.]|jgi:phycocyanobilin lyase alpha subunit|uniref:HEAT repeat domain-containing protein n=1 Tax=Vulcanococcus sp. TaxID=2856995 RepID=UPI003BFBCC51
MDAGFSEAPATGAGDPISEEEALRRLRLSDDPSAQYYAAWWLGRNRSTHPDAVPLLQEALRQRRSRDIGAGVEENAVARNAARALGKLAPAAHVAIADLLATLDDDDHGLREAAARALGELRAEAAVLPLQRRLASGPSVAGAQQPGTPRLVEPCEALLEALGDIGVATPEVVAVIEPFVEHERPLIRSAASRALLQLTGDRRWGEQLVALLQHQQLQVRRAALMDLGGAGWRESLEPIAATLAENSLKLIALRGLVENRELSLEAVATAGPDASTVAVLEVMDGLL